LAVAGLIKTTADEWGKKGIRINGIAPGYTRTQVVLDWLDSEAKRLQQPLEQVEKHYSATIPLGRFADPEEIAAAVAFLLSAKASFIHGTILTIDGGESRFPL
jgi:3-oxoacyl-[acyl-carrier protein] reductase